MIRSCPFLSTNSSGRSDLENSTPTRITHVCSAGNRIYGAVQSLMTLAAAQKQAGKDVQFVTFTRRDFGKELRELGYQAHEVAVRAKVDPLAIASMIRVFRGLKTQVVHTHLSTSSVNGTIAARLARIPCVSTVHGMSGKLSFMFADHLIGVSNGVKDHLIAQGVQASKVTAIYNGIEKPTGVLSKEEARQQFGIREDAFVFGTVARLTPLKGIDYSLEAFKILANQMPNAEYALVGNGDTMEAYRQRINEWGLASRVHFLGYQDPVWDSLATMDMFLFPSLKEAMGIAVVEALASGLPVVSTNVGGLPEVVDSSVGELVEVRDPTAMAAAAYAIAAAPDTLRSKGIAATFRATNLFSIQSMVEKTDQVYRGLTQ